MHADEVPIFLRLDGIRVIGYLIEKIQVVTAMRQFLFCYTF